MVESKFQSQVIKKIKKRFPGSIVLKNDPNYIQGIPDLLILYKDKWAALEVKRSSNASIRPNQKYYLDLMDGMSFARFINPKNEEDIFNELREAFED